MTEKSHQQVSNAEEDLDTELVYWLPDGAQLVTIEGGQTSAPSPPTSLAIFKIMSAVGKKQPQPEGPKAVVCVGPWAYPLAGQEQTVVLKNEFSIYIVPNPTSEHPNMFVGVCLPPGLERGLEEDFLFALQLFSSVKESKGDAAAPQELVSTPENRKRTSEKIAAFLTNTGDYLAQGTQTLATRTTDLVSKEGEKRRALAAPRADAPMQVSPGIQYGARVLHYGGKAASRTTKFLLDKIGDVGLAVGRTVAQKLFGGGSPGAGNESVGRTDEERMSGRRLARGAATVVCGGVAAASTVWISLEEASKTLLRCAADETVKTVDLRYGAEASETVHHSLRALGHGTLAGIQVYELGPRSIAGKMTRRAGLQVAKSLAVENNNPESQSTSTHRQNMISSVNYEGKGTTSDSCKKNT